MTVKRVVANIATDQMDSAKALMETRSVGRWTWIMVGSSPLLESAFQLGILVNVLILGFVTAVWTGESERYKRDSATYVT